MAKIAKTKVSRVYPLPSINPEAFIALIEARKHFDETCTALGKLPIEATLDNFFFGE